MRFSVENWSKKVFSRKNVGYGRYGRYVGYGSYGRYKLKVRKLVKKGISRKKMSVTAVTNLKIRSRSMPQEKSARSFLRVVFDAESFGDSPRAPFSRLSTLPLK